MKALLLVVALTLTGCTSHEPAATVTPSDSAPIYVNSVPLPDGRTVLCVISQRGGVSCDWPTARAK